MSPGYIHHKSTPLTEEEIEQKCKDIQEELLEVMGWKKEEEAKLADPKSSPQKKGAAKRALKKVSRRIDTVNGQILYWKLRKKGESHFKAGIEMNEYWAKCKEEKEKAEKIKEEAELPDLLKRKL
jgi:hypothetical protein